MRRFTTLAMVALVLAVGGQALADHHEKTQGEIGYFDAHNCAICKAMGAHEDMLHTMKWTTHKIDNGMVMIAKVPGAMVDEYHMVCKEMENKAKMVMSDLSKDVKLCGFCKDYGKLMQSGAKMQDVKTDFGSVTIVTSDNPQTVKMIHQVADRSNEEMKKMMAATH